MANAVKNKAVWKTDFSSLKNFKKTCRDYDINIPLQEDVSILAQPVKVGNKTIPNSLAVQPMEGADGDSRGRPGKLTYRRYRRFASGGAGLLWSEAIAVTPEGRANPRQLWLNPESKDDIAKMVKQARQAAGESMGKKHKPFLVAQLTHSGRYSKPAGKAQPLIAQRDPYRDPLSPEPYPDPERPARLGNNYKIVTDDYLDELQYKFVNAAEAAAKAGFDAVDIKACHGYLVNELLAARNRKGKYGGSFENRIRFIIEVMDKIKHQLGDKIIITSRLGFYDAIPYPYGWGVDQNSYATSDLEEPKKLVSIMREKGIELLNFTIANPYYNPHIGRPFSQPLKNGYPEPEHPLHGVERMIKIAGQVQKEFPKLALVGTGYSWLRQFMGNAGAAVKRGGQATIIGAGRMAFAYPDFAKDLLEKGRLDKKKVCIGCSACTQLMRDGQKAGCVVRDSKVYKPLYKFGRSNSRENLRRLAENCFQCQGATCQTACPAGIDIPKFIEQFLEGDDKAAYETIREANILPEVCAWLCPVSQQCEGNCLQDFIGDGALPIADIQRYLANQANKEGWSKLKIPPESTGRQIAVIGAGPAGLAAAAVLLEVGHKVVMFDKSENPGGMVSSVIPPERQSSALQNEMKALFADVPDERFELKAGKGLTEKFNLDDIAKGNYDAIFIGMGLPESIKISEEKIENLYDALTFLSEAKSSNLDLSGKRAAVIGGGNTAMDAASAAVNCGAEDVYVIYRRSFVQMPAWKEERDRAMEKGVHFLILHQPVDYTCKDGKLQALKLTVNQLGKPDESGRRSPESVEGSEFNFPVDTAVEAIGQKSVEDMDKLLPGVEIRDGLIQTKENSFETSRENVYAAGDIVKGADTVVSAVAEGMEAARQINEKLKTTSTG